MEIKDFNGEHISILGHQLPSQEPLKAVDIPNTKPLDITPITPAVSAFRTDAKKRMLLSTNFYTKSGYGKDWNPAKGKLQMGYTIDRDAAYQRLNSGEYISKYPEYYTGIDNDNWNARNQTDSQKITNTFMRFGSNVSKGLYDFVGSIGGLAYGIATLDLEATYDNKFTRWVDDQVARTNRQYQNYYNEKERNQGLGFNVKTFDEVMGGAEFTGRMMVSFLPDALIGMATGGATLPSSFAKIGGRAAVTLSKASRINEGVSTLQKIKNIGKAISEAVSNSTKGFRNLAQNVGTVATMENGATKISQWGAKAGKIGELTNKVWFGYRSAAAEAGMESRFYKDDADRQFNDYYKQLGRQPTFDEIKAFEVKKANGANALYAMNLGILGASNVLMFKSLPTGKLLTYGSNWFNKNILGAGIKKGADGVYKAVENNILQKIGMGLTNVAKGALLEGVWEEGMQGVASKSMLNYVATAYDPEVSKDTATFLDNFYKGFEQTYGTSEGLHEVAIGAIIGGLLGGGLSVGNIKAKYSEAVNQADFMNKATEFLNNYEADAYTKENMVQLYGSMNRFATAMSEMENEESNGDILGAMNAQQKGFIALMDAAKSVGKESEFVKMYTSVIEGLDENKIAELNDISLEEAKKLKSQKISELKDMQETYSTAREFADYILDGRHIKGKEQTLGDKYLSPSDLASAYAFSTTMASHNQKVAKEVFNLIQNTLADKINPNVKQSLGAFGALAMASRAEQQVVIKLEQEENTIKDEIDKLRKQIQDETIKREQNNTEREDSTIDKANKVVHELSEKLSQKEKELEENRKRSEAVRATVLQNFYNKAENIDYNSTFTAWDRFTDSANKLGEEIKNLNLTPQEQFGLEKLFENFQRSNKEYKDYAQMSLDLIDPEIGFQTYSGIMGKRLAKKSVSEATKEAILRAFDFNNYYNGEVIESGDSIVRTGGVKQKWGYIRDTSINFINKEKLEDSYVPTNNDLDYVVQKIKRDRELSDEEKEFINKHKDLIDEYIEKLDEDPLNNNSEAIFINKIAKLKAKYENEIKDLEDKIENIDDDPEVKSLRDKVEDLLNKIKEAKEKLQAFKEQSNVFQDIYKKLDEAEKFMEKMASDSKFERLSTEELQNIYEEYMQFVKDKIEKDIEEVRKTATDEEILNNMPGYQDLVKEVERISAEIEDLGFQIHDIERKASEEDMHTPTIGDFYVYSSPEDGNIMGVLMTDEKGNFVILDLDGNKHPLPSNLTPNMSIEELDKNGLTKVKEDEIDAEVEFDSKTGKTYVTITTVRTTKNQAEYNKLKKKSEEGSLSDKEQERFEKLENSNRRRFEIQEDAKGKWNEKTNTYEFELKNPANGTTFVLKNEAAYIVAYNYYISKITNEETAKRLKERAETLARKYEELKRKHEEATDKVKSRNIRREEIINEYNSLTNAIIKLLRDRSKTEKELGALKQQKLIDYYKRLEILKFNLEELDKLLENHEKKKLLQKQIRDINREIYETFGDAIKTREDWIEHEEEETYIKNLEEKPTFWNLVGQREVLENELRELNKIEENEESKKPFDPSAPLEEQLEWVVNNLHSLNLSTVDDLLELAKVTKDDILRFAELDNILKEGEVELTDEQTEEYEKLSEKLQNYFLADNADVTPFNNINILDLARLYLQMGNNNNIINNQPKVTEEEIQESVKKADILGRKSADVTLIYDGAYTRDLSNDRGKQIFHIKFDSIIQKALNENHKVKIIRGKNTSNETTAYIEQNTLIPQNFIDETDRDGFHIEISGNSLSETIVLHRPKGTTDMILEQGDVLGFLGYREYAVATKNTNYKTLYKQNIDGTWSPVSSEYVSMEGVAERVFDKKHINKVKSGSTVYARYAPLDSHNMRVIGTDVNLTKEDSQYNAWVNGVIIIEDEAGNPLQILKASDKLDDAALGTPTDQLINFRKEVISNYAKDNNSRVPIKVKEVYTGVPLITLDSNFKAIELNIDKYNVAAFGFIDANGEIQGDKIADLDYDDKYIKYHYDIAIETGRITPFAVIRNGENLVAFPINLEGKEKDVSYQLDSILNSDANVTAKTIAINNLMVTNNISYNGQIGKLIPSDIGNQQVLDSIRTDLQTSKAIVDIKSIDDIKSANKTIFINHADPFSSSKFRLDLSNYATVKPDAFSGKTRGEYKTWLETQEKIC